MTVICKTCSPPKPKRQEILRYALCPKADEETEALLSSCLKEAEEKTAYRACYIISPVEVHGNVCDFGSFSVCSQHLARSLTGCRTALLFAATVGVEFDRLRARYGKLSPSRALMLQAIGAERAEALCDTLCADIAAEYGFSLRPRFSPGYGDLPLSVQKELFALLDCERRIGLTLTDSLLMSPSKSVTAIAGIVE